MGLSAHWVRVATDFTCVDVNEGVKTQSWPCQAYFGFRFEFQD